MEKMRISQNKAKQRSINKEERERLTKIVLNWFLE